MVTLTINTKDFERRVNQILQRVPNKVALPAVEETAEEIIEEARTLVPVDTGALRDSLNQTTKRQPKGAIAELGSDLDYALRVHEDLSLQHTNGQAKYLSTPFKKAGDKLSKKVFDNLEKV